MPTIRPSSTGHWPKLPGDGQLLDISLGNGTRFDVLLCRQEGGAYVCAIIGRGAYMFSFPPSTGYLASKLHLQEYLGDAAIMADLIGDQLGGEPGERKGHYSPALCCAPKPPKQLTSPEWIEKKLADMGDIEEPGSIGHDMNETLNPPAQ